MIGHDACAGIPGIARRPNLRGSARVYVLGYWPVSGLPGLHRVNVTVNGCGAKVHARTLR